MAPKVPLDVLVNSLLQESSQNVQDSPGLKWEWEHFLKLEGLISKIREREANRDAGDLKIQNSTPTSPLGGTPATAAGELSNGTTSTDLKTIGSLSASDKKKKVEVVVENSIQSADEERRASNFPAFLNWLRANLVCPEKVRIENMGAELGGFGLKTNTPLKSGDVVFTIPRKIIITSCVAKESKIKLLVDKDPLLNGMQNVLLAIFLIYERYINPDSFWKPYIDILPHTFDTIMYFTKEEMMVLKNSPAAFREALRMYRNVARQYAYFHSKFKKATDSASRALKNLFTYNRYVWGVSAVTTRINHLPSPEGEPILSLIPLWDLCNHEESEVFCTDYNEEKETLICYAGHDYDKGSEFTIFYGRRSSVDFLVHNGFVPQSYRHDFYSLELGIGMNDLNFNRKRAILNKIGLDVQCNFPVKPDRLAEAKKLFAFVRVFQADKELLSELEEKLDDLTFLEQSTESCWKFLATRFLILKRAAENSFAATLKNLYGADGSKNLSRLTTILLQLLKNEQKVLEMLVHCADDQLGQFKTV